MNNLLFAGVMGVMTGFGALGGFCLKSGMNRHSGGVIKLLTNPWLYAGGIFYTGSTVLNIWVLKSQPYTIVLPLTALTYVWTMFLAKFCLGETITVLKIIGLCLIGAGAWCLVTF